MAGSSSHKKQLMNVFHREDVAHLIPYAKPQAGEASFHTPIFVCLFLQIRLKHSGWWLQSSELFNTEREIKRKNHIITAGGMWRAHTHTHCKDEKKVVKRGLVEGDYTRNQTTARMRRGWAPLVRALNTHSLCRNIWRKHNQNSMHDRGTTQAGPFCFIAPPSHYHSANWRTDSKKAHLLGQ